MSRRTTNASMAAIAASLMVIMISADGSGAVAQETAPGTIEEPQAIASEGSLTDEIVPEVEADGAAVRFISEEVVQELPETTDEVVTPAATSLRQLVSDTTVGDSLSEQMHCLAGAVYFESRGEPLAGQLAVAQVVINRAESQRFPSSYCGVVFQRAQFSFVKNGAMPRIKTSSKAWTRAKAIARIAHEGMWESEAADSLYFHANYVKPRWASKKLARATIKTHIFYR